MARRLAAGAAAGWLAWATAAALAQTEEQLERIRQWNPKVGEIQKPGEIRVPSGTIQTPGEIRVLLCAARKAEAATRHKENPALKTLGTRAALVEAGLLTNDLPL